MNAPQTAPLNNGRDRRQSRVLPSLIIGGGACYALKLFGPPLYGALINLPSVLAVGFLLTAIATILSDFFWYLGNYYDLKSARMPLGLKGTAGFVQSLDEVRHDLLPDNEWGPYFGSFQGQAVMAPYSANIAVIGVSGGGKGVGFVQPNILSIRDSKFCPDIKGEGAAVLARALRERGGNVHVINVGNVFPDILGESAYYNPLIIIADNFERKGGLMDITDDVFEMCMQLLPEPAGQDQNSDNSYFRDGSRDLIDFTIQIGRAHV